MQQDITFSNGVKACLPTVLGYMGIGIAFGIVGINSHLSVVEVCLLSLLVYGGSSQFVFCGLLLVGSSFSTMIFTVFLVNFRHFLMSLSASPYFKQYSVLENIGFGTLLTDESFGVLMTEIKNGREVNDAWLNGLNITAYLSWFFATLLGAVIGKWIPDPESLGLDYALVAMFIGLFVLQLENYLVKGRKIVVILFAVLVSFYLSLFFMSSTAGVLVGTLCGCLTGVLLDGRN